MIIPNTSRFNRITTSSISSANRKAILKKGAYYGKRLAQPLMDIKDIYKTNKGTGILNILKAILKQKGYGQTIGALLGVAIGTPTVVPGAGFVLGIAGCHAGKVIENITKPAIKLCTKIKPALKTCTKFLRFI